MKRVAIIHPWFPQYRMKVFQDLVATGAATGIEVSIFHGDPPPEWAERGDSVVAPFATRLPTRFITIGQRSIAWKSLREFRKTGPYDLVIVEQAIRNLETYALLLTGWTRRLAWWGHGRTYTSSKRRSEERLKEWMTRRGSWFFAYTEGGAQSVINRGFPADRVTVVNNSIDTAELVQSLDDVRSQDIEDFSVLHGLTQDSTLFIGALDESKRVDFLLNAATLVHERMPSFRLVIVGNGALKGLVERFSSEHPWCVYIGGLYGRERALALASARCILMPGRVGLVAVDSFASRRPIITTDWQLHAPEFEYLVNGFNAVIAEASVEAYSEAVVSTLRDDPLLDRLAAGCSRSSAQYSAEAMALNILIGIQGALARIDHRP